MSARWGHGGICSSRAASGSRFPDKWCLVWWWSFNESGGGCRSGEGSACPKDALGEKGEGKDKRTLDMTLGGGQMAPCRTHSSLHGQALHSQPCLGDLGLPGEGVLLRGLLRVGFLEVGAMRGFGDLWDC